MIYLKRFNENKQEDIESICLKYDIEDYTINVDGSIDVGGDVDLIYKQLEKIPLTFRNVTGSFNCRGNKLKTLKGAPQSVGGSFDCSGNKLTTLEGSPQSVGGNFFCQDNKLKTLKGAPKSVVRYFSCSDNKLTTLEGAPKYVGGDFYCYNNQLTALEGAPQSVGGYFYCSYNKLINLEFAPSCQSIYCGSNPIHKWWVKVDDIDKLEAFIDLGIDTRDPDFMNQEKIDLLE